jgi:hypothetical protein
MSLSKVIKIAKKIRLAAEKNPLNGDTLDCMCAICSYNILRLCEKQGITGVSVRVGSCHAFVMYRDYIIDVTATQFGVRKKIVCRKISSVRSSDWWWEYNLSYTSSRGFARHLNLWPCQQQPKNYSLVV